MRNKIKIEHLSSQVKEVSNKMFTLQKTIDKIKEWAIDKEEFQNREREDVMNFLHNKILPTIESCNKHLAPKIKEEWKTSLELEWFDATIDKLLAAGIKNPVPRVVELSTLRKGIINRNKE